MNIPFQCILGENRRAVTDPKIIGGASFTMTIDEPSLIPR